MACACARAPTVCSSRVRLLLWCTTLTKHVHRQPRSNPYMVADRGLSKHISKRRTTGLVLSTRPRVQCRHPRPSCCCATSTAVQTDLMEKSSYPYTVSGEPRELSDEDLSFLSAYTGEKDLAALRAHVVAVWRSVKDKALHVFRCIQDCMFLRPRLISHPHYPELQALIRSGRPFHILDVGTCFGQDTRQLLLDGAPEDSITVTDITPDYWELGKQLFMDGPRWEYSDRGGRGGVQALFGSFTDPSFVSPDPPVGPLGRLAGQVAVVWAGAVLHVLSQEGVHAFATHAHLMLAPGGAWIGSCVGRKEAGEWEDGRRTPDGAARRYLHSAASLAALMREVGFAEVSVVDGTPSGVHDPNMPMNVMLQYTAVKGQ